ncbi:type II toxin-antitoxin system HipA family toxin [Rhizobacter sp. Root1221]|uniref:type II toxin-antitoxin system HipA family toxin n=1 Tax=Rhizobacter sp. Root1221 TaxID=1736433 RepID=UPI0006FE8EB0|nr:type II toxin-antitoxin system HipA family toxin [Rhizobacter sp. Root1221]KQV99994.1 hypothetical protein ASC87_20045 [Rhizobacter sp. Root1221]
MVSARLALWMNGEMVGVWRPGSSRSATHTLTYSESWMKSEHARPLSMSLPFIEGGQHRGTLVESYFDNLLPDNDAIRRRLRARFGAKSTDAFDLLEAIGRDCVGAVQLLRVDEEPPDFRHLQYERIPDKEVGRILREVVVAPAFGAHERDDDFRISIAGAQEKTALLRLKGKWCRPHGATPTTHILKLPLGKVTKFDADFSSSVENEWLCAQIVRQLGLDVADVEMGTFDGQRVLIVERFDRAWAGKDGSSDYLVRIPQEDLCQATGTPPHLKYEKDGGPGIDRCLEVYGASMNPVDGRLHFVLSQLAFWLLAAPDGHSKNFSLFIERGGQYQATPLYDVLSAWPVIGKGANLLPYHDASLAMAIRSKNAHWKFNEIEVRHWHRLAMSAGGNPFWEAMVHMVRHVDEALEVVEGHLPSEFPAAVWDPISEGVRRHGRKFLRGAVLVS